VRDLRLHAGICLRGQSGNGLSYRDGAQVRRQSNLANNSAPRYHWPMIKSFRDKETERLFQRHFSKRLPPNLHRLAWRKLVQIDAAERLDDLRAPPGNRLEKLSGDRAGQYSIRINDRWRICFEWHDGDAYEVEITDYH